jgi:hypothetical protein
MNCVICCLNSGRNVRSVRWRLQLRRQERPLLRPLDPRVVLEVTVEATIDPLEETTIEIGTGTEDTKDIVLQNTSKKPVFAH